MHLRLNHPKKKKKCICRSVSSSLMDFSLVWKKTKPKIVLEGGANTWLGAGPPILRAVPALTSRLIFFQDRLFWNKAEKEVSQIEIVSMSFLLNKSNVAKISTKYLRFAGVFSLNVVKTISHNSRKILSLYIYKNDISFFC